MTRKKVNIRYGRKLLQFNRKAWEYGREFLAEEGVSNPTELTTDKLKELRDDLEEFDLQHPVILVMVACGKEELDEAPH